MTDQKSASTDPKVSVLLLILAGGVCEVSNIISPFTFLLCTIGLELGWYGDRHAEITVNSSTVWDGKLVGIDDYVNGQTPAEEHYVVVKIGSFFVKYNRAEGVMEGVTELLNNIAVTFQPGILQQSWRLKRS